MYAYAILLLVEIAVFIIGYLVAFIFHMASCGYLFPFVEFSEYSCFLGKYGRTVDKGGPKGQGFSHRKVGLDIFEYHPSQEVTEEGKEVEEEKEIEEEKKVEEEDEIPEPGPVVGIAIVEDEGVNLPYLIVKCRHPREV